jgi:hypothetical protein
MNILEFAKKNNLTLDIRWLPELARHKVGTDLPWTVSFAGTAIEMDEGRYKFPRGHAETIDGAILDYVEKIRGQYLISDPFAPRQFNIRILAPASLEYSSSNNK